MHLERVRMCVVVRSAAMRHCTRVLFARNIQSALLMYRTLPTRNAVSACAIVFAGQLAWVMCCSHCGWGHRSAAPQQQLQPLAKPRTGPSTCCLWH